MENPLNDFSIKDIKAALKIQGNYNHKEVLETFKSASKKIDTDLKKGFHVIIGGEDDGLSAVYTSGPNNSEFNVIRTTINGRQISESITGKYDSDGHEVSIRVDRGMGNPMVSCYVFLDQALVSSRTSPYDMAAQMSDSFLSQVVQLQEGDTSRLQKTIEAENLPFAFAKKMLDDYSVSTIDKEKIDETYQRMSEKDNLRWNK